MPEDYESREIVTVIAIVIGALHSERSPKAGWRLMESKVGGQRTNQEHPNSILADLIMLEKNPGDMQRLVIGFYVKDHQLTLV